MEFQASLALDVTLDDGSQPDSYDDVFKKWFGQIGTLVFVYDYILEKKKTRLNRLNISITALTAFATIIGSVQLGIDLCLYSWTPIVLGVLLTTASSLSALLSGYINTYGLNDAVNEIQRYLDACQSFYCIMANEQAVTIDLRQDRKTFIANNKDQYVQLISKAPNVNNSEYLKALSVYKESKERLKTNLHKDMV